MQGSNDVADLKKKHDDAQVKLTKDKIVEEYNKKEATSKIAKKCQRDVVIHYKVIDSLFM